MSKQLLFFLVILVSTNSFATDYYVSSILGKDSNTGLKKEAAFKTIQKAGNMAKAGDTVFVMDGTYKNSDNEEGFFQSQILFVMNSGKPDAWITFQALENHHPVLQIEKGFGVRVTSTDSFTKNGPLSYIRIKDLKIIGNSSQISFCDALQQTKSCYNPQGDINWTYNGHGVSIGSEESFADKGNVTHHIEIINCDVSECCGSGIGVYRADYITIENNTIYNNCWKTSSGSSGIHIYNPRNSNVKEFVSYHYIIKNNEIYNNRNEVPFFNGKSCKGYTDGNGIIIDDARNTQSNNELYLGDFLIMNNVIYENGGSAITVYHSDNVTIKNNSTYKNAQLDADKSLRGELILIGKSKNISIANNIFYANNNQRAFYKGGKTKNITQDNNILYNGKRNKGGRNFIKKNPLYTFNKDSEKTTIECNLNSKKVQLNVIPISIKKNLKVSSNSPAIMNTKNSKVILGAK